MIEQYENYLKIKSKHAKVDSLFKFINLTTMPRTLEELTQYLSHNGFGLSISNKHVKIVFDKTISTGYISFKNGKYEIHLNGYVLSEKFWIEYFKSLNPQVKYVESDVTRFVCMYLYGILFHEYAHQFFTDTILLANTDSVNKSFCKKHGLNPSLFFNIVNYLEDTYIENMVFRRNYTFWELIQDTRMLFTSDEELDIIIHNFESPVNEEEFINLLTQTDQNGEPKELIPNLLHHFFTIMSKRKLVYSNLEFVHEFFKVINESLTVHNAMQRLEYALQLYNLLKQFMQNNDQNQQAQQSLDQLNDDSEKGEDFDQLLDSLTNEQKEQLAEAISEAIDKASKDIDKAIDDVNQKLSKDEKDKQEHDIDVKTIPRNQTVNSIIYRDVSQHSKQRRKFSTLTKSFAGDVAEAVRKFDENKRRRLLSDQNSGFILKSRLPYGMMNLPYRVQDHTVKGKGEPNIIILIDKSGSTSKQIDIGNRQASVLQMECNGALYISQALLQSGIKHVVLAHTTCGNDQVEVCGVFAYGQRLNPYLHQEENIINYMDENDLYIRMHDVLLGHSSANADGDVIEFIMDNYFLEGKHNLLVVASDGEPSNSTKMDPDEHVIYAVDRIRQSGNSVISFSCVPEVIEANNKLYGVDYNFYATTPSEFKDSFERVIDNIL